MQFPPTLLLRSGVRPLRFWRYLLIVLASCCLLSAAPIRDHSFHTPYLPLGDFSDAKPFVKNNLIRSALTVRIHYTDAHGRSST